uniref:Transcriptional regulator n=1 Tax=Leptospira ellisii TaxID=2023197 RepID=A0A2N0B878_9LEPT|nr:transcriptional regulator [Leptospira ellisii]
MNTTPYQISCYLVATVLAYRTFRSLFLFYKNRKQVFLFYFAFLQLTYGFYLLFFTRTINASGPQEALLWERLENACIPIFGMSLVLFVNSYRRIFSKDFVYLYILLNVLLSGIILADPNSYEMGLAREWGFAVLGIVIYETDQPLLVQYFYLSGILMILWTLFKVIARFSGNPFQNPFLLAGLVVFCANVFLDILVAADAVPFPYTSHFGFLILMFSADSFLTSNQSGREIREELKQTLESPAGRKRSVEKRSRIEKGEAPDKFETLSIVSVTDSELKTHDEPILIRALGSLELERGGVRIPQIEIARKKRMLKLVKLLLIRFESGIHKEELLEVLCPGMTDKNAFNSLHVLCFRLRRILGNREALAFWEDRLFFRQDLVRTDFQLFEKHYEGGVRAIRKDDTELAIREFRSARSLYRGDFFDFDPYFPESEMRREYIRKSLIEIFRFLCEQDGARNKMEMLLDDSSAWIRLDDLEERAWRFHFEALLQLDRRGEALRKCEELRSILWKELGVEPETETLDWIERIRSGTVSRA